MSTLLMAFASHRGLMIADRSLLNEAVRPRSGKFHTYPHPEEKLDALHAALLEANALK